MGRTMLTKGEREESCSNGTVLYLDRVNVNILVMMLHDSVEDIINQRNWGKSNGSLCSISYNWIQTYNYLKMKYLNFLNGKM